LKYDLGELIMTGSSIAAIVLMGIGVCSLLFAFNRIKKKAYKKK
jgi:cbb3-type cytochrome oxidase subunit 3